MCKPIVILELTKSRNIKCCIAIKTQSKEKHNAIEGLFIKIQLPIKEPEDGLLLAIMYPNTLLKNQQDNIA